MLNVDRIIAVRESALNWWESFLAASRLTQAGL
jgi:hypothetical protein